MLHLTLLAACPTSFHAPRTLEYSLLLSGAISSSARMGAQMDDLNVALAYFYRNPPPGSGVKPVPYDTIARDLVVNKDGTRPTKQGVWNAVQNFNCTKGQRGRKKGWRKTTKADAKVIKTKFFKLRPPGHGISSPQLHRALPKKLRDQICARTLRNRLHALGWNAERKLAHDDKGLQWRKRRFAFSKKHKKKSAADWSLYLQGVADFSGFTYYPKDMQPRYRRLSATWTWMSKKEKVKPAFMRPKKHFFPRAQYKKKTRHVKLFGLTLSTGAHFYCTVPHPVNEHIWAKLLRQRVGPFLRQHFPGRSVKILLDGETCLHTDIAKAALKEFNITALPGWPSHSPDLNPQENVWAWVEEQLRARSFANFQRFKTALPKIALKYPGAAKLVPRMQQRVAKCISRGGGHIGQ